MKIKRFDTATCLIAEPLPARASDKPRQAHARPGRLHQHSRSHAGAFGLALPPVSPRISASRKMTERANYVRGFCLLLVWVLVLVAALCAEMGAVLAVGTVARMLVVNSRPHMYESARPSASAFAGSGKIRDLPRWP